MRKPALMGNWKMNKDLSSAISFVGEFFKLAPDVGGRIDIVLFPPFPLIKPIVDAIRKGARWSDLVEVGAQDMHPAEHGAFTGAVSGLCIKSVGADYVIVGHSERRWIFGDTDTAVNSKLRAAIALTLHPILCVGETLETRKAGMHFVFLQSQLDAAFAEIDPAKATDVSIAYEPIWAIGTGVNATPVEVGPMIEMIRRWADGAGFPGGGNSLRILYGGSVNEQNSAGLYAVDGVDGFLVGGASLEAFTFAAILDLMKKGKK